MAKSSYKLSCELIGHTGDVRGLDVGTDGSVVSASRDKTAVLWKFQDGSCIGNLVMKGHSNFVSSVCIINPSQKHPKGFIVTGSNDNHIFIYIPGEIEPAHKIKAHENTVCCLKRSNIDEESFLSSSWDITAKLWNLNNLEKPQVTYVGHSAAVWCVSDLPNGSVVTGAADKSVIVYARDGKVLHKLNEHTDCVRDISVIKENEFLSCANDAVIKHWSAITGDCLGNFYGHTNYIYSMSAVPGGSLAVSSGEDQTVRVWANGEIEQTITLPAQSVWCVKILPNEDIACGSSDGMVRIFSANPQRYADSETLQKFEESVANSQQKTEQELGLKNVSDSSALNQPGKKDGETKLIKEGGGIKAYSWSQSDLKWTLIGDVMGSNKDSDKKLYNGIEYDYVFSVDIQDGVPPLKLPYNNGQDPWHVAQKFIDDNQLSQYYLEQVANFIVKNSTQTPVVNNPSQFYDPFTGGNRYIPSSTDQTTTPSATTPQRQVQHKSPEVPASNNLVTSSYIPLTNYLKIDKTSLDFIREKLRELNTKVDNQSVPNDKLELVVKLATVDNNEAIESGAINTLAQLFNWPENYVFPVLDIARLAVLYKNVNDKLCTEELISLVRRHLTQNSIGANQMLTYRLLANMFIHEAGEKLGLQYKDEFSESILNLCATANKNNQVAMSTYMLNLVLAINKTNDSAGKKQVLCTICKLVNLLTEPEARFRVLVGLGTLLSTSSASERSQLINTVLQLENNILNVLQTQSAASHPDPLYKIDNVSKEIINLIVSN